MGRLTLEFDTQNRQEVRQIFYMMAGIFQAHLAGRILTWKITERGGEDKKMESPEMKMEREQDALRNHFNEILTILREWEATMERGEKTRAVSIAKTQTEIASMCTIRSFFADVPYSPLNKLKPVEPAA